MIILKLTSRPSLSLLLCSTYLQYCLRILLRTHVLMCFFMISRMKYTKNVLVGSPAALVRDEIHCNEYPGTRQVMSVGYPGSKISTRFNPSSNPGRVELRVRSTSVWVILEPKYYSNHNCECQHEEGADFASHCISQHSQDSCERKSLTLTVPVMQLMHSNTLKQDNDSTVRGDGGSRVGEVRAGTTSPMPEHKGFMLQ